MLKTLDLDETEDKTVLVRCGFDVEVENGRVSESATWRIDAAVPFLKELSSAGAKTIVLAHLGRPGGHDEFLSLRPVFEYLKKEFGENIKFESGSIGKGQILLKENVRFDPREEANDDNFAKELAEGADFYVNNDFATAHRAHTSTSSITKYLPSFAGPLLLKEVEELEAVREARERPLVLIMGGAKSDTKVKIVGEFVQKADLILIGGVLANTILKKRGYETGISVVGEEGSVSEGEKVILPVDAVVSTSLEQAENVSTKEISEVKSNEAILDVGPETVKLFAKKLSSASQIVWNGPLGLVEIPEFRSGSSEFAKAFTSSGAKTLVGGGDIVKFLAEEETLGRIDHVSTGGGAMLAFLAGERLPALEVLGYYDGN